MTASFKPVSVAIGDLTAHPANVRSNSPETYDPENIAHLKASIAVLGLLQPLLVQKIDGYRYTVKSGVVTFEDGEPTGALPGKLVRGPQAAPTA